MNKMDVDQDMARRLREARKLAGYNTRQDAVDRLGFVYSTYANHEGGHRPFKREAPRYAKAFRVNLIWLVNGTGTPRGKEHSHPVVELFDALPPDRQSLALRMLQTLKDEP